MNIKKRKTLLLGSQDCEKQGGGDSQPLLLRRGLHLCLSVNYPATAILRPRAPLPSLCHFLFLWLMISSSCSHKFTFLQFGRPEVQDQGVGKGEVRVLFPDLPVASYLL
jgi:hypothetical protein